VSYNNNLQLNIKQLRKPYEEEYNVADYMPTSEKSVEGMYEELLEFVKQIDNKYLRQLAEYYFVQNQAFIKIFKEHSAAKSVHHSFADGLLEHTLSIVRLCEYYAKTYPLLNKDLLYSAALFHDIGKTKELSAFPENDYTDDGQLLGHIVMGVEMVGEAVRAIPGFPPKLASELKHCVVAHHGELEYGSPKKPALAEAFALNFADCADARMQSLTEIFKEKNTGEWLGFNRVLDSNIRKTVG
jgi:3'-5' exoribonuclease